MISAPLPENEEQRIRALEEVGILDTLEEQAYDDLTHLAAQICGTPIALVSLVDRDRQWFKSHYGLGARETPRDAAFCAHAILADEVFVVEDSSLDTRFHDNPLATGAPHVKFYAGAPLIMRDNLRLGTLCVIDNEARELTIAQKQALEVLARQVVSQLELRLKVKELQSLDRAKDEFLSMISHELRTPLTSIYGSLALLNAKTEQLDKPMGKMVTIAYRNTDRLLAIVNDILDLSKMEAGKLDICEQPVDLVSVAKQSIELNEAYCEQCGCEVVLDVNEHGATVVALGDEQRLLQVLGNLISNAAKFTHEGDIIEISLVANPETATIKVTDHGPGIPRNVQESLFQKFKQVNPEGHYKFPGTGLGLNICKHIVELHQGDIDFESIPGEHTTFYFSLPIAEQEI